MDSATELFLREGLSRYAEAEATVRAFEEAASDKVGEIAAGHTEGLRDQKGKAKLLHNNVCKGDAGGRVAYAQFEGRWQRQVVRWEIGIWWEHPSQGKSVVAYVECTKGPDELRSETWAKAPTGAGGTWEAYKGGLHLHLTGAEDVTAQFERLLDEVVRQLAALRA